MKVLSWPQTPLGPLWASLDESGRVTALHWQHAPAGAAVDAAHPLHKQLSDYFSSATSTAAAFSPADFAPKGTPFQQKVWQALLEIPAGRTQSYADIAAKLHSSPRAVGGAVGSNPVPIFIPCHRVMGKNGSLTGFSAPGGLVTKTWLLQHEGILLA